MAAFSASSGRRGVGCQLLDPLADVADIQVTQVAVQHAWTLRPPDRCLPHQFVVAFCDEQDVGLLDLGDNGDLPQPLQDGEVEVLLVGWVGEVLGKLRGDR